MTADLRNVSISAIRENPVALRGVDREDPQYVSLRDSIGRLGVQDPITVREKQAEDGSAIFEIVNGLHRYSASLDTGKETIPVHVITADEASVLELQIVGNLCHVDTPPAAYANQLRRMFSLNPTMTLGEMAEKVSQSPAWVNQRLSLTRLDDQIQKLVDDGSINVSNGYALSKLPKDEQLNFLEQAQTMTPGEFGPTVNQRAKELRDAARQGKEASPATFTPVAHLRKVGDIKTEVEVHSAGPAIVASAGAETAIEGFYAALNWVMSLDASSVAKQEADYNARTAKREEEKKKAAVERADKKAAEATAKAQEARAKASASA